MKRFRILNLRPSILIATLMASVVMASCASPQEARNSAPEAALDSDADVAEVAQQNASADKALNEAQASPAASTNSRPQLVKTAELVVRVDSVTAAIQKVTKIINQQQGDVLRLNDQGHPDTTHRQTARMELRVPQEKLDRTLEQLSQLGIVQSRSLSAKDVSNQLVDYQARLRNLRKSEQVVLQIMERSGSIADVLKVSQELANIRASIEQIDAQLQQLQTQVAFSKISLTLEATIATTSPQRSLGERLQEAFSQSTHAVGELTVGLLALSVWLLAFSPYIIGLCLFGLVGKRFLCRRRSQQPLASSEAPPSLPAEDSEPR